jgi:hypothetical protein
MALLQAALGHLENEARRLSPYVITRLREAPAKRPESWVVSRNSVDAPEGFFDCGSTSRWII